MTAHRKGFTLIELLAVLAIVGILTSVAYPSYAHQIVKARRVEAQLALLDLMQRQEQYRAQHHTYIAFSIATSVASVAGTSQFRTWLGNSAAASAYELDGAACPDQPIAACIVLRARPGTANVNAAFSDRECGTLTLDSTGAQGASGASSRCWP